jgi:drug/metabolite transporter (DMT)-like permease
MLWALAVIVVARSVTNLIAPRFTLAIYVQLIILMTPFEVVLLGRMFFGERVPHGTYSAITLSLLGALLMMSGEDLRVRLTALDLLGIGLALFSSICLALYMLIVRRAATRDVPPRVVFAVHNGAIFGCTLLMSVLLREPWTGWRSLSPTGWLIFAALSGGVFLGGNLGQIGSIGRLGAAPVSALMASRLLATLAVGALVLNERPETPLQWFGALIVMMTISWYLWRQYRAAGEDASIKA